MIAAGPVLAVGSFVVKACVTAPMIRLHTCELHTAATGELNRCNMTTLAAKNATAASTTLPAIASANITFGAEYSADGSKVQNGLVGALEEIFIEKVDTRSWTHFNWNVPREFTSNLPLLVIPRHFLTDCA